MRSSTGRLASYVLSKNVRDDIHRREEDAFRRFEDHLGVMTVGSRSLATIGGGVFGDEVIQIDLC